MRRVVVGAVIGAILSAPIAAPAHGGRGGGFGGGGGGGHFSAPHPTAHAPTFSQPANFSHAAEFHGGNPAFHGGNSAFHGANPAFHESFAHGPANFSHAGAGNFGHAGFENHAGWAGYHNPAYFHAANMGYRPNYYGSWYHGSWGGHYGYPWGYRPAGWGWGWGLGGFGLGLAAGGMMGLAASPYSWGYYSYSNPYYYGGAGVPAYANYSQPLMGAPTYAGQPYGQPIDPNDPNAGLTPPDAAPQDPALIAFNGARSSFQQGDYQGALAQVNQALTQSPNDSVMQEFRATCLFALQDYQQSAAAMYAVLSSGPGWDWTTMSGLYANNDVYTGQLRALEAYRTQNPNAAYAHFLLAYQYMLLGYKEQAAAELNAVVALQPSDQLAAQLLRGLTTPAGGASAIAGTPPALNPPGQPASPQQLASVGRPIDPSALTGNWQAARSDGSAFGLKLSTDNTFSWQFSPKGQQPQTLTGTYTVANDYLILKASDQNTLLGQVAMVDPNRFTFKLAGDNPSDPGLKFTR